MSREYSKDKNISRRGWLSGPWESEPDFYEWLTKAGYPAYAARLDDGCWFGVVEAPYPTESNMLLAFCNTIRDKTKGQLCASVISKTDREGIGEWHYSMERYQSPIPKDGSRGPYRTLEDIKQHCEDAAEIIFKTHTEKSYINYFK